LYKLREDTNDLNAAKNQINHTVNDIVDTCDPKTYCKNSAKYHRTDRKNDNIILRNNKTSSFDIPDQIETQNSKFLTQ